MKTALLFPGYGSQFIGMGKEFYNESRIVQEYFEQASNCLDTNFVKLCFASSDIELGKMNKAYTALFLVGSAISALLKEAVIPIDIVAGYNSGEYTALFAAEGINFVDGLYLLHKLSGLYQDIINKSDIHSLYVSGVAFQDLATLCALVNTEGEYAAIAMYATKITYIVSGSMKAIEEIKKKVVSLYDQAKCHGASVENGLVAPVFTEVVNQFKMYLEKVDFNDLKIPLLSCLDGTFVESGALAKHHIIEHINSPVRWDKIMESCSEVDLIIAMCPSTELSTMLTAMYPEKKVVAVNKSADIDLIKNIISP